MLRARRVAACVGPPQRPYPPPTPEQSGYRPSMAMRHLAITGGWIWSRGQWVALTADHYILLRIH